MPEATVEALRARGAEVTWMGTRLGLEARIVPAAGKPTFDLPDDEMEIGMGIHGEAGIQRGPRKSADEVTGDMMKLLLADLICRDLHWYISDSHRQLL